MPLSVQMVTADREILSAADVDAIVVPGGDGQLTILPRHAALMTTLASGGLIVRSGASETLYAVTGGFLEVSHDRVTILADQAESAEDIDEARAEAARRRAEERLRAAAEGRVADVDLARARASMLRALVRLQVADRRRRRPGPPRPGG